MKIKKWSEIIRNIKQRNGAECSDINGWKILCELHDGICLCRNIKRNCYAKFFLN